MVHCETIQADFFFSFKWNRSSFSGKKLLSWAIFFAILCSNSQSNERHNIPKTKDIFCLCLLGKIGLESGKEER